MENIEDSSQFPNVQTNVILIFVKAPEPSNWITNQYLELQRSPVLIGLNYSINHFFTRTRLGWYPKWISKQVQPLISMDKQPFPMLRFGI